MPSNLADVIKNTREIYMSDSALQSLMDFERVVDELNIYVYDNWKKGELVEGPIYEKYFVRCKFMWPYKLMPDPKAGKVFFDYGCSVKFEKDFLEYPKKVKEPDDFKPGTKTPKMLKAPVWVVEIIIPKNLMTDIEKGSVELENEKLELEDIEQAYETEMDEKVNQADQSPEEQTQVVSQLPPGGLPPPASLPPV